MWTTCQFPILIADDDFEFRAKIEADPWATAAPPVIVQSFSEAQAALNDEKKIFAGIFVNPSISQNSGVSIIRQALAKKAGTPVYLLYDGTSSPLGEEQLNKIAVQKALRKPISYSEIVQLVAPIIKKFDADSFLLKSAEKREEKVNQEFNAEDSQFTPIRAETFISGKKSFFNVYVRLDSGRYVKLLQAGDAFDWEQLLKYLQKGVRHFFIRKEVQTTYLSYCDHLASTLINHSQAPLELQFSQALNHGEETLKYLQDFGVNGLRLDYAKNFVRNALKLTQNLGLDKVEAVQKLMSDLKPFGHSVATTIIASLIAESLDVESPKLLEMIGVAALVHDIGLHQLAIDLKLPGLLTKKPEEMTPSELTAYNSHPLIGAKIVGASQKVDLAIVQAIAQHHERKLGKGFPFRLSTGRISQVAEIIGLADEFLSRTDCENPFHEMNEKVFSGFSADVVDAFCLAFLRNRTHGSSNQS